MLKFALRALLFTFLSLSTVFVVNAASNFNYSYDDSLSFSGYASQSQFGSDIKISDINDDGHLDMLVSSPYFSSDDKTNRGRVDVYFGPIQNSKLKPDLSIFGANENDLLGTSIDSADINGDGINDIIVGAYQAQVKENYRPGAVYMFIGREHFFLDTYDLSTYQPDLSIYGPHNNSFFGSSLLMEDMNGDNDVDVVVGAPLSQNDMGLVTGNVYSISWQNFFNTNPFYDLSYTAPDILISGQKEGSLFGAVLKSANLNRNNDPDLLVSAYTATINDKKEAGAVYLFSDFTQNSTNRVIPDTIFEGEKAYDWFGFNVNIGNLNEDAYDDIFISSFSYKKALKRGRLYGIYGSDFFNIREIFDFRNSDQEYFVRIDGDISNHMLGRGLDVEDLDKDGETELILSSPNISSRKDSKSSVLVLSASDFLNKDSVSVMRQKPIITIESDSINDWFGQKIILADMNRDGHKELVISAPYSDNESGENAGSVHVFFMQKPLPSEDTELNDQESSNDLNKSEKINFEYDENEILTRGDVVSMVIEKFKLEEAYSDYLGSCRENLDFCMFVFASQSKFGGIRFTPDIILYPDVPKDHHNYKNITVATMLGLVHGNISDTDSPFKPDFHSSRIQALKIIIEGAILERSNFFAEIIEDIGGNDDLSKFSDIYDDVSKEHFHMWWYPRYINFAYKIGVLSNTDIFRPDEAITRKEFDELLDKVYNFAR